mmetsp:Transcript_139224/g.259658  ORF Transcript_139224/g.259658 Transcript_139224/m.259658 type:complete len:213 (-) Transcript_139224:381-1019(-)
MRQDREKVVSSLQTLPHLRSHALYACRGGPRFNLILPIVEPQLKAARLHDVESFAVVTSLHQPMVLIHRLSCSNVNDALDNFVFQFNQGPQIAIRTQSLCNEVSLLWGLRWSRMTHGPPQGELRRRETCIPLKSGCRSPRRQQGITDGTPPWETQVVAQASILKFFRSQREGHKTRDRDDLHRAGSGLARLEHLLTKIIANPECLCCNPVLL